MPARVDADGVNPADALKVAMANVGQEPLEPVMPRKSDKSLDSLALSIHTLTGEELVGWCTDVVGDRNARHMAKCLFEWHLERLAK